MPRTKRYLAPQRSLFSIERLLRHGILVLMVTSILVSGAVTIYASYRSHLQLLLELGHSHSRELAGEINSYIENLYRTLSYLSRIRGLSNLPSERQKDLLEGLSRHNDAYELIAISDSDGHTISSFSQYDRSSPQDWSDTPLFARAMHHQQEFVGHVRIDPFTKIPSVTFGIPVRNEKDEIDGVLVAQINLKFLQFLVNDHRITKRGSGYVIDNRGTVVVQRYDGLEDSELVDVSDRELFQRLLTNSVAETPYIGLDGVRVRGVSSMVDYVNWQVVVEIPVSAAYEPLYPIVSKLTIALGILIFVAVVIGIWFTRLIVAPLRNLTTAAQSIGRGDLTVRVNIAAHNEMGLLADIFNHMASQVEERTRDLERSNQDLEQFAYACSHDLQEPLRMIAGYTQLLASRYEGQLDATATKYIGYAVDGVARMQQLIHGLLEYSQVTNHRRSHKKIDLNTVCTQAIANLQAPIKEVDARVTYANLPSIEADSIQMVRLLQNLISNAIKYSTPLRAPEVHISAQREQREWVLSIKDNGIGIEPQYMQRIFMMFQRLHARNEYQGLGIGLALCKKIVERHHGRIWVESELGQGSTFSFSLPLQASIQIHPVRETDADKNGQRRRTNAPGEYAGQSRPIKQPAHKPSNQQTNRHTNSPTNSQDRHAPDKYA